MCGWTMKNYKPHSHYDIMWKCVWNKCKWEAFQSSNGTIHWWQTHVR